MKRNGLKENNKGFSLVELIIVMAIMAILIGAIAPQVMSYVENSRESKDMELLDTVYTAAQTAIASKDTAVTADISGNLDVAITAVSKIGALLPADINTAAKVHSKLKSKKGTSGTLYVNYNCTTGVLTVFVGPDAVIANATLGPITN